METVELWRYSQGDQGSFGVLQAEGIFLHTLELPDRNNVPNFSCIPAGEYLVTRRYSPSFKRELYHVRDVKGRSFILVHGANFAGDVKKGWQTHLQGCITLGMARGSARNKYGKTQKCVFRSREAVRALEDALDCEPFKLIVKDFLCLV